MQDWEGSGSGWIIGTDSAEYFANGEGFTDAEYFA